MSFVAPIGIKRRMHYELGLLDGVTGRAKTNVEAEDVAALRSRLTEIRECVEDLGRLVNELERAHEGQQREMEQREGGQ